MKKVDSQALGILTKSLGLSGAGAPVTELTDGVVDQAIDIAPIVRRSRTQAATEGIYIARLVNAHTDAQSLTTSLAPFNPTTTALPPYPLRVSKEFDIWMLSASLRQTSGGGTLSAALFMSTLASHVGMSTTGGAGSITQHAIAFWDALLTENQEFGLLAGSGLPFVKIGLRMPRSLSTAIVFASTSSLTATFELAVVLGVFPVALGQDVIV